MINNAEKLTAKWIPVTERLPKLQLNTLLFKGGIPEPAIYVWYNPKTNKWLRVFDNEEVTIYENSCWLEYNHSDYPDIKW